MAPKKKAVKNSAEHLTSLTSLNDENEMTKARIVHGQNALLKSWTNLLHDAEETPHDQASFASPELVDAHNALQEAKKLVLKFMKVD